MRTSRHAFDSYSRFYPGCQRSLIAEEVHRGVPVERRTALSLVGRARIRDRWDPSDWYVLHRERTGLFAGSGDHVVTFLRFYSLDQHRLASKLWPGGDVPSCCASWIPSLTRSPTTEDVSPPDGYLLPRPPPEPPRVSRGVRRELSLSVREVQLAVQDALEDGLALPGTLVLEGTHLLVTEEDGRVRVGLKP